MAFLKNQTTEKLFPIKSLHIFGRNKDLVSTFLSQPDVSGTHAKIIWNGTHWEIFDYSRNGTYLNGSLMERNQQYTLKEGMTIGFSQGKTNQYKVIDLSLPIPLLLENDGSEFIELRDVTPLPNHQNPVVSLFVDNGCWMRETNGELSRLSCGETINVGKKKWIFFNPINHEQTQDLKKIHRSRNFLLRIIPSSDLEEVQLIFRNNQNQVRDLGYKNPHFLLYILAKARSDDIAQGLSEKEAGWIDIDTLCNMLKQELNHINIQVYRLRKSLIEVSDQSLTANEAIQRRKGAVRIGFSKYSIE